MSVSSSVRCGLGAVGLLALVTACGEQGVSGPEKKNAQLILPQVVTTTNWDLVQLTPAGGDLGASIDLVNAPFGKITASSPGANTHVFGKDFGQDPLTDPEKGLGLCLTTNGCTGDNEIGTVGGGLDPLLLTFFVLPSNSVLTHISLGSVQTGEGWKISANNVLLSAGVGDGINNPNAIVDVAVANLSTTGLVLKFETGAGSGPNDYLVRNVTIESSTGGGGCTFTQGYWKNHGGTKKNIPNAWPVSSLTLGTVSYTQAQLIAILEAPPAGNGLISLAHQLIAAKLNVANGASPAPSAIADADALIGGLVIPPVGSGFLAPATTSTLNDALTAFNEGTTGPGHCTE